MIKIKAIQFGEYTRTDGGIKMPPESDVSGIYVPNRKLAIVTRESDSLVRVYDNGEMLKFIRATLTGRRFTFRDAEGLCPTKGEFRTKQELEIPTDSIESLIKDIITRDKATLRTNKVYDTLFDDAVRKQYGL